MEASPRTEEKQGAPQRERFSIPPPRVLRFRTSFNDVILDVLRNTPGLEETQSDTEWELAWVQKDWVLERFDACLPLKEWQRVNHFRNYYEITRKDLLIKNLKRTRKQFERDGKHEEALKYDFFPQSFYMPSEYALFLDEFKRNPGQIWIMKPTNRSLGKGIFLINKLSQVTDWRTDVVRDAAAPHPKAYIVQRYIDNPLLIGGKKFDCRVYVLVLSYVPLVVYLYRTGFARFTHHRFSLSDIGNTFVHLTNVAIQKNSDAYTGHAKWETTNLRKFVTASRGVAAAEKLFLDIQDVLLNALLAVQRVIIQDKHCYELYGYDILIDDNLKPWIIEVNACPSMTAENEDDYRIKTCLLQDTIELADLWKRREPGAYPTKLGGFDLIYNNGPVIEVGMLGAANRRLRPLDVAAVE
eukprot:m51a1_g10004 putative tubulin tyrosine ligase (412) ;mRNA; f:85821-87412